MPRTVLRLVAMLIALAVPLQGMAAVATGLCMAFGHHEGASGHAHGHDGESHAHDGESHAHDAPAESKSAEGADAGTDGDARCGPCAACCASASIGGPPRVSILSSPSDIAYLFSPFPPTAVQPLGLDRPPLPL